MNSASAQSCKKCCNLIENPVFDPLGSPKTNQKQNPIKHGFFAPWARSHGSPDCIYFPYTVTSGSSNLGLRHNVVKSKGKIVKIASEGFSQTVSVINSKPYVVAVYSRHILGKNTIDLNIDLTQNKPLGKLPKLGGAFFPTGYGSSQNILSENISSTSWSLYTACFTANSSYANIWLYNTIGATQKKGTTHILVDNVELIENFDFALRDTAICQPGAPVDLTTKCDSFLNFTATYEWKDLTTNQIVGTTRKVTVNPMATTMYQVKRTLSGTTCPGYDTVTVTVGSNPIIVDLGPDTAICAPNTLLLDAGYHGLNYSYNWYKGTVHSNNKIGSSQTYLVSNSGSYIAEVTDTVNGCIYRDTINVTVNPEVKVYPDTFYVCDTMSRTYQFDAGDGYLSYMWNGDPANNSRYFSTNVPGYHIVEVVDSNGCIGIDTGLLVYRSFSFKLPNDTVICPNSCVFVPVRTDSAFVNYAWNDGTSDTSRTICNEGSYILTITDSLGCTNSDTINIYEHPDTSLNLSDYGPVCWEDTFLLLIKPLQDDLGYFNGTYVNLDTFWIGKGAAGPGIHKVKYNFIDTTNRAYWNIADSSVCWLYDSLNVLVAPLDSIYIDTLGPLCLNAPIQAIIATPPGGIFRDSSNATLDSFLASNYGVGTHLITYTYIDSNGCKYTAQTWVQVTEAPTVEIKTQNINCIPCYGASAWAVADTVAFPKLKYFWSNGDTTRKTHALSGDTLIVWIQNSDSTCFGIDTLIIDIPNCCNMWPSFDPGIELIFTPENPLMWENEELVIDRDIIIRNQHSAVINLSNITMLSCTKIIVENGSTLTITDSKIGGCGWKGIEVWGNIDVCTDNPDQGIVDIERSEINCADVAIFSGLKDMTSADRISIGQAGGIVKADDAHFKANYVDLFFTPQNFYGMCNCTTSVAGQQFQHKIVDCTFDTLANDYYCEPIVDDILNYLEAHFVPTPAPGSPNFCGVGHGYWNQLPMFSRCHIIDMNPYNEYFVANYPIQYLCPQSCNKRTWLHAVNITIITPYTNTYIGTSFNGTIMDCDNALPFTNFKP